jgi:RNA polymerase sigma-70 factor (ECF subfamily)
MGTECPNGSWVSRSDSLAKLVEQETAVSLMAWLGTDAQLLDLAKNGDPTAAAAAVYDRFSLDVNRLVWRLLGADAEHDDVVQQVFVHIITGLSRVRDAEALSVWMASVCVKTVRSEIRRRRIRRFFLVSGVQVSRVAAPVQDHESRDLLEKTYSLLELLPADERIAFALRYIDEQPLAEVAAACNCSLATAKRRLQRAAQRFTRLASRDPAMAERLRRSERWDVPAPSKESA